MGRKEKEMQQYRNDGMAYAYKIVKEQGIEALEKEIKYRKATFLPSAVQEKDVNKFVYETKINCLDTVLIMAMMVLRDEFDFGEKRINRFKERFNRKTDVLLANNATWQDLQETLKDEVNVDTVIRNADQIYAAQEEKNGFRKTKRTF